MTISQVSVGGKVTASKTNEVIDAVNLSAMFGIVPTSVSGAGVSVDSTTGVVTFTAASSVTVDGCFPVDFRNFEIEWDIPTTSANLNLTFQLRDSGTTATTGYDRLVLGATGAAATATVANNLNQASWQVAAATTAKHFSTLKLVRPGVAVGTAAELYGSGLTDPPTAASTFARQNVALWHRTATAHDGFVLAPSTGTFTGTITVRGIR